MIKPGDLVVTSMFPGIPLVVINVNMLAYNVEAETRIEAERFYASGKFSIEHTKLYAKFISV